MESRQERKQRRFSVWDVLYGVLIGLIFFGVIYGVMAFLTSQITSSSDYQDLVKQMQQADITWKETDITVSLMLLFVGGLSITMPSAVREGIINQVLDASSAGDVLSLFGIDLKQVLAPLTFDVSYGTLLYSVFGIGLIVLLFLVLRIKASRLGWTIRSVSFFLTVGIIWFVLAGRGNDVPFLALQDGYAISGILPLLVVSLLGWMAFFPQKLSGLTAAGRASLLILMFASTLQLVFTVQDEAEYDGDSSLRTALTVASLNAGSGGMYDWIHGGQVVYQADVLGANAEIPVSMLNGETSTEQLNDSIQKVVDGIDTNRVTEQLLTLVGGERPDLSATQLKLDPVDYGVARQTIQAIDAESAGTTAPNISSESAYWVLLLVTFVIYFVCSIRSFKAIIDPFIFAIAIGVISFIVSQASYVQFAMKWRSDVLFEFAQQTAGWTVLFATGLALLGGILGYVVRRKPEKTV
ncbi:hypothetical protein RCC94_02755 [Exiguobacterium acetylicum]|uniref:hypothetical protein n=1 Tax=Exiguobacterium acetylicum TaxID=41170 RepID=UPI0027E01446|nr:hypothetical protein [Exiguobacterium acetylicum]MDQ6466389.1 hypothetical protein [Exiguobacterium acetylicum]